MVISSPLGGLQSYPAFEKATRPYKQMTPPRRTCRLHRSFGGPEKIAGRLNPDRDHVLRDGVGVHGSVGLRRRAVHLNERGLQADEEGWRAFLTDGRAA